ncbi:hypothetical protein NQ036_05705 [Brevibacterium sp. 91QC2O2]|uniref:hypothetical protein n=1 Tax=Brevibacterium sp. 91QC2O2 TaxID=2968458 RepID=UPI00211C62EC|nr:hypothetical protein [Brevibacterium sp. 91QC2O2]MCQ9367744.1 hypothetical protein [Brevibacterium sp. 91QC2O2]
MRTPTPSYGRSYGRRSVLMGFTGITVLALTGCGLRLEQGPVRPTPGPADTVRSAMAELLARIQSSGGTARAVSQLRAALGPARPTTAATASATGALPAATGLRQTVSAFFDGLPALAEDAAMLTTLADVAVGAGLTAAELPGQSATVIGRLFVARQAAAPATVPSPDVQKHTEDDRTKALAAFVTACYQAGAGYTRVAVAAPTGSAYRTFARERIAQLNTASAQGNALLRAAGGEPVANRPAWSFDSDPHDETGARTMARGLEDLLAARIGSLLLTGGARDLGVANLWYTGWARGRAGGVQAVRFDYTGQNPGALAPASGNGE